MAWISNLVNEKLRDDVTHPLTEFNVGYTPGKSMLLHSYKIGYGNLFIDRPNNICW